ncbi:MAG: class I mannose-6-phosphate isomerase [Novosphingobium sp.]
MNGLLATTLSPRPWGLDSLPAPFASPPGERIGEVWFTPPAALDALLVKYLFTSAALSVQVHPDDAQAPPGTRGKEECWYVLGAEPGAKLGIGFTRPVSSAEIRAAALDGSIEQLLAWHAVRPGSFFYIPAGTVHAIGPGIRLIEVQQNSDTTYRLYDYGRPRELQLDAGIAVARGEPYSPDRHRQVPRHGSVTLVEGPHFRLDRLDGAPDAETRARYRGRLLVIPLDGPARIGAIEARPGQCALADSLDAVTVMDRCLIAQPCA